MSGSTVTKQTVARKLSKPAWATTEFGGAVFALATALVTLLGVFNVNSSIGDAIMKAAAVVALGGVVYGYAHARARTKASLATLITSLDEGHGALDVIFGALLLISGVAIALIAGKFLLVLLGVVVAVIGLVLLMSAAGTFARPVR